MRLHILRHAKAEKGFPDATRQLSERGRAQAWDMGAFFRGKAALGARELWCSPLTRARETAELFEEARGGGLAGREVEALEPEADPEALVPQLAAIDSDILLVGHNPNLEILLALLLGGSRSAASTRLRTGSLACLERGETPEAPYELIWLMDPRLL